MTRLRPWSAGLLGLALARLLVASVGTWYGIGPIAEQLFVIALSGLDRALLVTTTWPLALLVELAGLCLACRCHLRCTDRTVERSAP